MMPIYVPVRERWELEAASRAGDVVILCLGGQLYFWRKTSNIEPWPTFPGPGWTFVQDAPSDAPDAYLLARNTNDPAAPDSFLVGECEWRPS